MSEAAKNLEARVQRMVAAAEGTPREQKLEAQVKWLADRLAIAVGLEIDLEMEASRADAMVLVNEYRGHQDFILSDDPQLRGMRKTFRSTLCYERGVLRVKEYLVKYLKGESEPEGVACKECRGEGGRDTDDGFAVCAHCKGQGWHVVGAIKAILGEGK